MKLERIKMPEKLPGKPTIIRMNKPVKWNPRKQTTKKMNLRLIHNKTYNTVTEGLSIIHTGGLYGED